MVPVSRDRVSPLKSPPGDSISIQILFPEDLFQNRFAPPGNYILKQSLRGRENVSSPVEINSPLRECLLRRELGYIHITFIANQSTLFLLTHLYLNYALFASRNLQNIKRMKLFCETITK